MTAQASHKPSRHHSNDDKLTVPLNGLDLLGGKSHFSETLPNEDGGCYRSAAQKSPEGCSLQEAPEVDKEPLTVSKISTFEQARLFLDKIGGLQSHQPNFVRRVL